MKMINFKKKLLNVKLNINQKQKIKKINKIKLKPRWKKIG